MKISDKIRAIAVETRDGAAAQKLEDLAAEIDASVTAIFVHGGIVQDVVADRFQAGTTLVVDYDCEGGDAGALSVPQPYLNGKPVKNQPAIVNVTTVEIVSPGQTGDLSLPELLRQAESGGAAMDAYAPAEPSTSP